MILSQDHRENHTEVLLLIFFLFQISGKYSLELKEDSLDGEVEELAQLFGLRKVYICHVM